MLKVCTVVELQLHCARDPDLVLTMVVVQVLTVWSLRVLPVTA